MLCDDGKTYVVKFKENPQGLRILANEVIAGEIAAELELPCAEVVLVEITADFIGVNPALRDQYTPKLSPGDHFGIVEIKDKWRQPPRPMISKIANKQDLPAIVAFDAWTLNTDRNNDGNYLIVQPAFSPRQYYFSTIDHGMCFTGPQWNATIANQVDARNFTIIPEVAAEIRGADPFAVCLEKAVTIAEGRLRAIVESIPEEWKVDRSERAALVDFLIKRRERLREILFAMKGQFPFWTG